MTNVTNHHNGMLNVAGIDVRPGATVWVDNGAFDKWSLGNGAKIWLNLKLITSDSKVKLEPAKVDLTEREQLELKAIGHSIAFTAETSDEDLLNAILEAEEAEEAAKDDEREALLKAARDLGLNPNANTGIEKLKKLIAEKKVA